MKEAVKKTIKRNYRANYALLAVPLIIILGLYVFYLTQAYYFSIDPSYIVLRAGVHQFTFLPGFGRVVIQTDFKKEDLANDKCGDLDQGKISGFWFLRSKEGYELWGDQLADCLNPTVQAKWLRSLRESSYKIETLPGSHASFQDTKVASNGESNLEQLAKTKPGFFTPEIIQALTALLSDKNINVRSKAASVLRQLAETNPESFTPEITQSLTALLINQDFRMHSEQAVLILGSLAQTKAEVSIALAGLLKDRDPDVRYRVAFALEQLATDDPSSLTEEMVQNLVMLLTDKDSNVRSTAASALGQIAKAKPEFFMSETVRSLAPLLSEEEYHVRAGAASAFGELALTRPEFFTPEIFQSMTTLLTDRESFVRSGAAFALGQLAVTRPEYFTDEIIPTFMTLLTDRGSFVPCSAAFALSKLAQAKPELFTSKIVQSLTARLRDEDSGVRSNIASALVELAQRKPGIFTPGVVQELIGLLSNEAPTVRSGAASVLGTLTQKKLEIIQNLFFLLKNEKASNRRNGAAEALFVAALKDTHQKDLIEDELQRLVKSHQPELWAAASQTLEMISIGDLIQEAHTHPDQLDVIKSRLDSLERLDESLHEEHLRFAAQFVLAEIEKIPSMNK